MARRMTRCVLKESVYARTLISTCYLFLASTHAVSQETPTIEPKLPDLAKVKEEEAREKLERLEDTMDRLAQAIAATEPQNAAKLKLAFRESRDRLLREGMDRVVKYLEEKKLDRAIAAQGDVRVNLEEILSILLEKDIDPRELLKHIRRIRDIVKDLDQVVKEETSEKMASDDAHEAGPSAEALSKDLQKLEDLIAREKKLEKGARDPENAEPAALGKLAPEQESVRTDTSKLREEDAARAPAPSSSKDPKPARPGEPGEASRPVEGAKPPDPERPAESGEPAEPSDPADPSAAPREPGSEPPAPVRTEPPPAKPKPVLERKALERAEEAMAAARDAMEKGAVKEAGAKATEARSALEEAALAGKESLERLRAQREWKKLKEEQEGTREDAEKVAAKMQEAPPLVSTPEEGVPGKSDVEAAARDMQEASGSLGQGKAGKASKSQAESLDKLKTGREKAEAALEELQRALRERILAYLREKFTRMLNDQRVVSRETKSLDLKLRALRAAASADLPPGSAALAAIDRKDRLTAESLSARESAISVLAEDVIDLLDEDGTTLVFPGVVVQIQGDLTNVSGLLSRIETGDRTQHIQREIEVSIEEILKALETAQKSPPPPNPSQGRSSKSGAGPLLPLSSELKMVRSLQKRINERTTAFDLARKGDAALSPEEKLQVHAIAKKQGEVEDMLRKLKTAAREP